MKLFLIPFLAIFLSISFQISAQINVSAQLRPRFEMRHGYKNLPEKNAETAYFVSQRSRMNFELQKDKYSVYLSFQDVRVWGDESNFSTTGITGDAASIDLFNAYFLYTINEKTKLKVGRQEFIYFDQRLLSARNWNQYGIAYDAFLIQNKFSGNEIDIALSYNNSKENTFGNTYDTIKYKTLNFLTWKKTITENIDLAWLNIAAGKQKGGTQSTIYMKYTSGLLAFYKIEKFNINASYYYQYGKNESGSKVSANFYSIGGTYKKNNIAISLNYEYLSGQDQGNLSTDYTKTDHRFDILYGARHKYYGYMDYFSNLNKTTSNSGLSDFYVSLNINKQKPHQIQMIYHFFQTAQKAYLYDELNSLTILDKNLGSEIDLIYSFKMQKDIQFEVGFCSMFPSKQFEELQKVNSTDNFVYWLYTMITFSPSYMFKEISENGN